MTTEPKLTPEEIAEYESLSKECLNTVLSVIDETDWKEIKKVEDCIFYSRSVKGSSFSMVKSETTIPLPFDTVAESLYTCPDITSDMTAEERDGVIERTLYRVCGDEKYDEGILYLALESGSKLVSPRDFVMFRKHYEQNGTHYFTQCSVPNETIRPEVKKFVRGKIIVQAFIVDKDPNNADSVRVRFVVHADPRGSIPAMIYNTVASNQGYAVKKLKDSLLNPKK